MDKRIEEMSSSELEAEVEQFSRKLERLRALYEQYFLGIEKRPPYILRKDIVRMINQLQRAKIRNTATKYKLQQLMQKFSMMKSYWNRTEREIENGTYRRHRFKVKEREKRRSEHGDLTARDHQEVNAVRDRLGDDAARKLMAKKKAAKTDAGAAAEDFLKQMGVAPTPKTNPDAKPASEIPRGVSSDELAKRAAKLRALKAKIGGGGGGGEAPKRPAPRAARPAPTQKRPEDRAANVYNKLVETKRSLNQSTDKLSKAGLEKSLAKQRERVMQKHKKAKDVEFDVVVRDGKAFIKPKPVF